MSLPDTAEYWAKTEKEHYCVKGVCECESPQLKTPNSRHCRRCRKIVKKPEPITYRDFVITYDSPPIGTRVADWQWAHCDYDGPEDRRIGHSPSLEQAKADIDELLTPPDADEWRNEAYHATTD